MTTPVDVIIVSFNTRDVLLDCVRSLVAAGDRSLARVIVVDNASSDGSPEAVRAAFPRVEVVGLDRNLGFAAANNIGLRQASAPLALLLNSDTVVPAGALDQLAGRLEERGATVAGPRLVRSDGRPEVSFGRMLSPVSEATQWAWMRLARRGTGLARRLVERRLARERWVDWVSGACLLVRREGALAAGLLDERYFMYEEDVDFCAAIRRNGGRVLFTPDAEIVHLGGRSGARRGPPDRRHYDRSHLAFYEKHAPGWTPWLRLWLRLRGRRLR